MRFRSALIGVGLMVGLLWPAGAVANASVEFCGVGAQCVAGPFGSSAECLSTQSNYARYYRITAQCFHNEINQWFFGWADK